MKTVQHIMSRRDCSAIDCYRFFARLDRVFHDPTDERNVLLFNENVFLADLDAEFLRGKPRLGWSLHPRHMFGLPETDFKNPFTEGLVFEEYLTDGFSRIKCLTTGHESSQLLTDFFTNCCVGVSYKPPALATSFARTTLKTRRSGSVNTA